VDCITNTGGGRHEADRTNKWEARDAPGGLDLVDGPIPVAHGLDRHGGAPLTALEKLLERSALVRDALFADDLAVRPGDRGLGVMFVGIERDIFHVLRLLSRRMPSSVVQRPR